MTNEIILNKNTETHQELLSLKTNSKKEFALKSLLNLALVVTGVVLVIFSGILLDVGIGLALVGALAIAYHTYQLRHSLKLFSRAAQSLQ